MGITKNFKYFIFLPALLTALSIGALFTWGLRPGVDLAGGSQLQVRFLDARPDSDVVRRAVEGLGIGEIRVQQTGEQGYLLRQRNLSDQEHRALLGALSALGGMEQVQFSSIGPSLGQELMRKAWIAIALVSLCTSLFIAFAFRNTAPKKAREPGASVSLASGRNWGPSSWKYGVVAIVTLLHDIIVPVGLFALLGYTHGAEVDALFIVALLTILGISINDTIVIFDRIRENLRLNEEHNRREGFESVVERSIGQTITRSINTSLAVIIVLMALWLLGPEATRTFALVLIVGMVAGTYSSIFLASPLLVAWHKLERKKWQ